MGRPKKDDIEDPGFRKDKQPLREDGERGTSPYHEPDPNPALHEVPVAVVEQRVSNLSQGAMCLILLTGPFLHILHLIPRGVLAGLL